MALPYAARGGSVGGRDDPPSGSCYSHAFVRLFILLLFGSFLDVSY